MLTATEGTSIAGEQHRIVCTIQLPEGLTNPVVIEWYDTNGHLSEDDDDDITIEDMLNSESNITSVLEFELFRTVHGGRFACTAKVTSPAPPFNISKTSEVDVVVGGEFHDYSVAITCLNILMMIVFFFVEC